MVPVVEVVEQIVQDRPLLKTLAPGHHPVVGPEEFRGEPPEHSHDGQVELVVAVEWGGVEQAPVSVALAAVAGPQVAVKQAGPHLQIWREHLVHFPAFFKFLPQFSGLVVSRHFNLRRHALIGVEMLPVVIPAVIQWDAAAAGGNGETEACDWLIRVGIAQLPSQLCYVKLYLLIFSYHIFF